MTRPKCWLVHKSICATALRLKIFLSQPIRSIFFIRFIKYFLKDIELVKRGPNGIHRTITISVLVVYFCLLLCICKRCGSWTAPYQGPNVLHSIYFKIRHCTKSVQAGKSQIIYACIHIYFRLFAILQSCWDISLGWTSLVLRRG